MDNKSVKEGNWVKFVVHDKNPEGEVVYARFDAGKKLHSKWHDYIDLDDCKPIPLTPDILKKVGFVEDKRYELKAVAHRYILGVPVVGDNENLIQCMHELKKNTVFGNYTTNGLWSSNDFHYLHQLQNLYFALTGKELEIKL